MRGMFDRIAGTYDLLNHLLSAGIDILWRRKAIDGLGPEPSWRVLDLATGTGDLGFEVSRRDSHISVVGVDVSIPMLRRGIEKAESRPGRTTFCCGDAGHLQPAHDVHAFLGVGVVANYIAAAHETFATTLFRVLKHCVQCFEVAVDV